MEGPNDHRTDGSSIQKPVSSLRSHFENMSTSGFRPQSPTTSSTPTHNLSIDRSDGEARHESRTSLDVPRQPSPWSMVESAPGSQQHLRPGPPTPRPRRPASILSQRPASMISVSTSQSPPPLAINPPPKDSRALNPQITLSTVSKGSFPPPNSASRIPPLRVQSPQLPIRSHGYSALGTTDIHHVPRSSAQFLDEKPIVTARAENGTDPIPHMRGRPLKQPSISLARATPPPVNRADKPKIPTKPAAVSSKVSLEPALPSPKNRLSPFSTPSNSGEENTSQNPSSCKGGQSTPSSMAMAANGKPSAHRRPTSVSKQDPFHLKHEPQTKYQSTDARDHGFTQRRDPHNALPEDRPGLPPRRPQPPDSPTRDLSLATSRLGPPRHISRIQDSPRIDSALRNGQATVTSTMPTFLPPPKRDPMPQPSKFYSSQGGNVLSLQDANLGASSRREIDTMETSELINENQVNHVSDYPDMSNSNRRPPYCLAGVTDLETSYDARLIDLSGQYVCITGHITKVWDVISGDLILSLAHGDKEVKVKVTSLAFKPGAKATDEGSRLWLGTNFGDIQELDIASRDIVISKSGAHDKREILRIYRHQNAMWTLDDGGKLCVWAADESGLPNLHSNPTAHRVSKGHTCSLVIQGMLWLATGKEIRVFSPSASSSSAFSILSEPICQPGLGVITCGTVIDGQMDRVYFGHADGRVSIYSISEYSCLSVVHVSIYRISTLVGAGFYLWAGYSSGMIYVYDTRTRPWIIKKDWSAHSGSPILNIVADRSSLWKTGVLRLTSVGSDNTISFWDGTLESDWLEDDMREHDIEYCTFREMTAIVMTWNAGAATPTHLRYEERDSRFFHGLLQANAPPDLLVFGFQELVDLEDKKLTAKSLFKGNRKRDPTEPDHMSHQYRAWRDYLVRCIEDSMPPTEPYQLLHTASMVGLFSCIFIKASQRHAIRSVDAAEVKRGIGGLHGNKGALIIRILLDDSSICLVNCHLAAGQTQTVNRNNDIKEILEAVALPPERNATIRSSTYVGGGDGSMILDNEICVLNGDLNYRIDTMSRDTVVKAVNANNLAKLLERDQLLVSQRRSPVLRIRAFRESLITFPPTYKYDVGSDRYDTSEKRRAPAWCDRILYRGNGKIKQLDYRRHELWVSDHRPVSGVFRMRIKTVVKEKRVQTRRDCEGRFEKVRAKLAEEAKIQYLRDFLGVPPQEAQRLI